MSTLLEAWLSTGAQVERLHNPVRPFAPSAAQIRLYNTNLAGDPVTTPDRPTGPEYIRYEDLYVSGDSVTSALARMVTPQIVTFPEGRFQESDFSHSLACIEIPKQCKGIIGSGQGSVGSDTGTVFSMVPNTSTHAGDVPAQDNSTPVQMRLLRHIGAYYQATFKNFRVEGTDQGHIYHNFTIYNPKDGCIGEDLLVCSWTGNNGAPPGETFGLEVHAGNNHRFARIEGDGRRNGVPQGAVGMTVANSVGTEVRDSYFHHCRAGQFVVFQSFNTKTYNMRIFRDFGPPNNVSNFGFNHERTAGTEHWNPIITIPNSTGVHITHSNDSFSANYDGTTRSTANGSLKVVNPVYNDIYGNGRLYIQSWTPYWTGDSMTSPPLVTQADGVTHKTYSWVHGTTQIVT